VTAVQSTRETRMLLCFLLLSGFTAVFVRYFLQDPVRALPQWRLDARPCPGS
jgi:hypothetical protein